MEQKENKRRFFYPKSESDYVKVWKWKISRPFAYVLMAILFVLCLIYIIKAEIYKSNWYESKNTYSYDSFMLNFISGNVRIRAEAGYIAYEGEVDKGKVTGTGKLYGRDGNIIYSGEFKDNEYNGTGKLYGGDGGILYEGEFLHNVYEGTGCEYSIGGTVKYEGMFNNGKWNGKGILYDNSSNPVYEGNFVKGNIVYKDFLGKTTENVRSMYTGKRDIYYDDSCFIVDMMDIDAMYSGSISDTGLDDKVPVNKIFVKSESSIIEGKIAGNIDEVKEIAGAPVYEGSVNISTDEAVALSSMSDLKVNPVFDDAMEITGYNEDMQLYIYSFHLEGFQYTFYNETANGNFIMYSIEQLETEGKGANE